LNRRRQNVANDAALPPVRTTIAMQPAAIACVQNQRPAMTPPAFTISADRHIAIVNETYIRREEATSSMEQGMTPSSKFMVGRAFSAAFALIISSMSAHAGAQTSLTAVAPHALPGARATSVNHPINLGPPAKPPSFGVARRHHNRRFFARRYYGADAPFVYNAPTNLVSPGSGPAPQTYNDDEGAPRRIACANTRVVQVGPVESNGPLPRVLYGSPPPCSQARYTRGAYPLPE
jgi:hypothetical protein